MEYTLRDIQESRSSLKEYVLILILMEYTLRGTPIGWTGKMIIVLILILMEYTLRALSACSCWRRIRRVNPYSNGIYSTSQLQEVRRIAIDVLILILMEYTLRELGEFSEYDKILVLILILMEYTLRG